MKLIKMLPCVLKRGYKKKTSFAVFRCSVCHINCERPLTNGMRNTTCGSAECVKFLRTHVKITKGATPIRVVNMRTNEVSLFVSQMQCSRVLDLCPQSISKVVTGKRRSTGGYLISRIE